MILLGLVQLRLGVVGYVLVLCWAFAGTSGRLAVEEVFSPIGLGVRIFSLSLMVGLVGVEAAFSSESQPCIRRCGEFFEVYHLAYRIRPPPRPP